MSTTASQQFEGATIEEALGAAVSTLGEDLRILDAQRVRRRGLLAIRKRERFEVTAAPGLAEPKGFEDVLRRMVERVDDAERAVRGAELADTNTSWWSEADFVVPEPATPHPGDGLDVSRLNGGLTETADPTEVDVRSEPAMATLAAAHGDPMASSLHPGGEAPAHSATTGSIATKPARPARPVVIDDSPVWSRAALLALDLPPALIGRMRCEELVDDLDWVGALARAIGELLETAASVSGPCELTGHGAEAAVHLLRGACDGFRLDSLVIDGRRVPATPLELALAIRALLRSGQ